MKKTSLVRLILCGALIVACIHSVDACTLCSSVKLVSTFREDLSNPLVNVVLAGYLGKATLNPDGSGTTELSVEETLRKPAEWKPTPKVQFRRYLPGGEKNANTITVLLGNWRENRLEPIRAIRLESKEGMVPLQKLVMSPPKQDQAFLVESFSRMLSPDQEIANDAFMEWAKADDSLVTGSAKSLQPSLVRRLLNSPETPGERLGLLSFLLGSCGDPLKDSEWFEARITSSESRWQSARDGLLAGYVVLNPSKGWPITLEFLSPQKHGLQDRLAVMRSMKMLHASGLPEFRNAQSTEMIQLLAMAVSQKELADIAIDYLRQWKQPSLEEQVLATFPAKGEGPLLSRSILQYALSFKERPKCKEFLAKVRKDQPDLVREVEELFEN
jgi:hypothetical protein